MTQTLPLGGGRALKSIPLSAYPPEAWRSLTGQMSDGGREQHTPLSLYQSVPWLYRAVEIISQAVSSLPYRVMRGDEPVEGVALLRWYGEIGDLFNLWAGDFVLHGAAYGLLTRTRRGEVVGVRRLAPQSITPKYDERAGLLHFVRTINRQQLIIQPDEMVYVFMPNREAETGFGISPAKAALKAAGVLSAMDTMTEGFFADGAIRPTLAVFEGQLLDAERERVETRLRGALTGLRNAFKMIAVSRQVSLETVGEYPDRLAMPELTDAKRQDICTALGIPNSLLFSAAANYATAQQDALNFYDLTVIPLARRFCAAFNTQALASAGYSIVTAENELELYQQFEGVKVDALAALYDRQIITLNEFRERMGLDALAAEPNSPDTDSAPLPVIEDEDGAVANAREELRAWERFAAKRMKANKPMRAFRTEHLPPPIAAALAVDIEAARSTDDLKAAFLSAADWLTYP